MKRVRNYSYRVAETVLVMVVFAVLWVIDHIFVKDRNIWCFQVGKDHRLNGNLAAFLMFSQGTGKRCVVLARIKKLVRTDQLPPDVDVVSIYSLKGFLYALRSDAYFVHHRRVDKWLLGIGPGPRRVVNLWHGIPIKAVRGTITAYGSQKEYGMSSRLRSLIRKLADRSSCTICSSPIDRLAMAASLKMPYRDVWLTGLPRTDVFFKEPAGSQMEPRQIGEERGQIRALKQGRKLVLYAPTFRETVDAIGRRSYENGLFPVSCMQREAIAKVLKTYNAVLGIRLHPYFAPVDLGNWELGDAIVNFCAERFVETESLLLETDFLITDYSSIWLDFILTGRPACCWAYDLERYEHERGWIYPLEDVFPGPILMEFDKMLDWLIQALDGSLAFSALQDRAMSTFYRFRDGRSSERLFQRLVG